MDMMKLVYLCETIVLWSSGSIGIVLNEDRRDDRIRGIDRIGWSTIVTAIIVIVIDEAEATTAATIVIHRTM